MNENDKIEFEKGLLNAFVYGTEGYEVDDEGSIRCLSIDEIYKIIEENERTT